MQQIQVPKKADGTNKPSSVQRITLDGVDYYVTLTWNMRAGWFLGLQDADRSTIFSPKRLAGDWDLLSMVSDNRRPRGALMCLDMTGEQTAPGFDGLGVRHRLVYFTDAEASELGL